VKKDNTHPSIVNSANAQVSGFAVCAMLFILCVSVEAQEPKKVPQLGYVSATDRATDSTRAEAIRLALREFGYVEEQNIAIEYRYADGKRDRYRELLAELVRPRSISSW
jgi:putative ABC transport system substrate-binding protein